jgi:hypothetical protein
MELALLSNPLLPQNKNDDDSIDETYYNTLERSFKYALAYSNLAQVIKELDIEAFAKKRSQSLATQGFRS